MRAENGILAGMVRSILRWLVILIVFGLIALWFLGGGVGKIIGNEGGFGFSLGALLSGSSSLASFSLPFSPQGIPQMIPAVPGENPNGTPSGAPNGDQSPYRGSVVLAQGGAIAQTPGGQYLVISSPPGSPGIDLAGWSLQSPLSGKLATIPEAASPFWMGRVNAVGPVVLSGGGVAYIVTGNSPVGVSFSENECTGYLGTLQPFVPALSLQCPTASSEIPDTPANEARLGASCFSYIRSLPPCTFPAHPPSSLGSACTGEIQTKLSYNGCLAAHVNDAAFSRNAWRAYLGQGAPLWSAGHDVVRLLDGQGRVVSVLNY